MKILQLPHYNQSTDYTCGPAAIPSFLAYHNVKFTQKLTENRIAQIVKTCSLIGTHPRSLHYFLKSKSKLFSFKKNSSLNDLTFGIDRGLPSIVLWHEGKEWHWSNVIGYDKNNIILLDPYLKDDFNVVSINEFNSAWSKIAIK